MLEVRDTGHGMSPEIAVQVFSTILQSRGGEQANAAVESVALANATKNQAETCSDHSSNTIRVDAGLPTHYLQENCQRDGKETQMRALVVDDSSTMRAILRISLKKKRF